MSEQSFGAYVGHRVPLRLFSDGEGRVVDAYEVRSRVPGWNVARSVFIIAADGVVRYRKVRPFVGLLLTPKETEVQAAIRAAQHD